MDMPDSDDERDNHASNMRVSIAPVSAPSTRSENDAEREAAMLKMKNTLLQTKPGIASGSVNRRNTRGGRSRQSTLRPLATDGLAMSSAPPVSSSGDDIPIQTILDMHKKQQNGDRSTLNVGHTPTPGLASPTEMLASPTAPAVPQLPVGMSSPGRAGSILSTSSSQQNLAASAQSPLAGRASAGFRASILESVNVLFAGGQVQRVMITGEISLVMRDVSPSGDVRLRISNFGSLDKTAPNHSVLSGSSGDFTINTQALAGSPTPATTVFKYTVKLDPSADLKAFVPVEINPQWKIEPNQTSFLLAYNGNPASKFSSGEASPFGDDDTGAPSVLHDVFFSVPITSSTASNMQTKPEGLFSAEKRKISWRMDDLDISTSKAARLLARYTTEGDAGSPQPVSVHWRLPGRLASSINLEAIGLPLDEVMRNTQSGKYMAQP